MSHFSHNFVISILPLWFEGLCQVPRFVSMLLWAVASLIWVMSYEKETGSSERLPRALVRAERLVNEA
jgi:hypothetical protein